MAGEPGAGVELGRYVVEPLGRIVAEDRFMGEDELFRAELMGKLDHVSQAVERLEKRFDEDSKDLFERVRKLEIDIALQRQSHETWTKQSKRDFAILAAAVGTGGGAIASAVAKLIGG